VRQLVIAVLLLAFVGTAIASDRSSLPTNPQAYYPPDDSNPAAQNDDGFVIVVERNTEVYSNLEDFLAVIEDNYFFDDFEWCDWGTVNDASYQFGPVNGFSYTASAEGGIFSVPGAMSTNSPLASIVIDFDGIPVTAVGGDFFATDFDGNPVTTTVAVTLNDGTTVELSHPTVFAGFTNGESITQLVISVVDLSENVWATYDNFYVGQMGAVSAERTAWSYVKALFR
jgi:hypothetical protein